MEEKKKKKGLVKTNEVFQMLNIYLPTYILITLHTSITLMVQNIPFEKM